MSVKITELRFVADELQFRDEVGAWLKTSPGTGEATELVDYAIEMQEKLKKYKRKAGAPDKRPLKAARNAKTHCSPSSPSLQATPVTGAGAEEGCVHCGKELACIYCGAMFKSYGGSKFCYDECMYSLENCSKAK